MSGQYQAALYLGDVSERVRILKNCGQSEYILSSHTLFTSPLCFVMRLNELLCLVLLFSLVPGSLHIIHSHCQHISCLCFQSPWRI